MIFLSSIPERQNVGSVGTTAARGLPCQTQHPELWFADNPDDVARARELCRECPVRRECLAGAMDRGEEDGVWGGEVFWRGAVVRTRPRRGRPRKRDRQLTVGARLVPQDDAG